MASLSSTSSVSSANSLGNTSLRGFGGMASGIDRDSIIEAMTLGTETKIANQQKQYTKLQWKQEAYRSISDKIIDWSDKYASYSSTSNLLDALTFAKNKITVHGKEESTKYVTATGSSQFVDNISIAAVKQLATSTVLQSQKYGENIGLETGLKSLDQEYVTSNLEGSKLIFGTRSFDEHGNFSYANTKTFTLPSSYTYYDETLKANRTKTINYNPTTEAEYEELAADLNKALAEEELEVDGKKIHDLMEFKYDSGSGQLQIQQKKDENGNPVSAGDVVISHYSSALEALGYKAPEDTSTTEESKKDKSILISEVAKNQTGTFADTAVNRRTALQGMTGKKLNFNFDGSKKDIELITADEAKELQEMAVKLQAEGKTSDEISKAQTEKMAENLQKRLNKAFGKGNDGNGAVKVSLDGPDGTLRFTTQEKNSTLSITSTDNDLLRNLGLEYGASTKVNLNGKLTQSALKDSLGTNYKNADGSLNLEINGVKIEGLTEDSNISDILSKINSTTEAGVKATYVESEGRFMLVSSETGAGREIELGDGLAKNLFGGSGSILTEGKNAQIDVNYGNGATVSLERASNTFDLEGLSITVSGTFGGEYVDNGSGTKEWKPDATEAVRFSAKADVDGVTEKVKSFFEDFNALVKEVNKQVTTRPDNSYEPLTDEQKDEMDETSIENWEKKAKEGILYGDSAMRGLSSDIEMIFSKLMSNGASYEDLKKIGITYSEDYLDGGTLVFDESAFRSAMESDPDLVSNIFTGGGNVKTGLVQVIDDTFTPYATRYASKNAGDGGSGSYGQLIEIAGSEKKPTTLIKNQIYEQLKQMQQTIDTLKERLETERDRYISQFTYMETMINQFNSQSSYLSQISG